MFLDRNRRRALPALVAALALGAATAAGVAGCDAPWEDEEPTVTIQTETVTPTTQTQKTQTGSPSRGEDREGNDIPPPPGSPAERFERFCRQNPGACD